MRPIKCIECKTEVVHYYRSMFCKDCIKNFFEGEKDIKKVLENGEVIIKTEEGIYFHALDEKSMPLLIGEKEGKELMENNEYMH